jgi:alpha-tubulin suppressor-like RCC1 family protein
MPMAGRSYCACTPSGDEVCNGEDDDCDGVVDGPNATCGTPGEVCMSGMCACPPSHQCSLGCADITTDRRNCGMCGNRCTTLCESSTCMTVLGGCGALESACALTSDGAVRCFGDNSTGEIGDGTRILRDRPTKNGAGTSTAVVCGGQLACAMHGDGSVRCWGGPVVGQGTVGGVLSPVVIPAIAGATNIAIGYFHACAVLADATVVCWGVNDSLQLGAPTTDMCNIGPRADKCSTTPIHAMNVAKVAEVAVGLGHSCALHLNGDVECWGGGLTGRLGDGGTADRLPNAVPILHGVTQIAAGGSSTCALMNDSTVACWGDDGLSQLGAPGSGGTCGTYCSSTPQVIPGLTGVAQIALGTAHACARMKDGTLKCWGDNSLGQVGNVPSSTCGNTMCVTTPTTIPTLMTVADVFLGQGTTFVRRADGALLGWGDDTFGQLGDGSRMARPTPGAPLW